MFGTFNPSRATSSNSRWSRGYDDPVVTLKHSAVVHVWRPGQPCRVAIVQDPGPVTSSVMVLPTRYGAGEWGDVHHWTDPVVVPNPPVTCDKCDGWAFVPGDTNGVMAPTAVQCPKCHGATTMPADQPTRQLDTWHSLWEHDVLSDLD